MLLFAYGNEVVCKRIPLNILGLGRATLLISYLSNGSLSARNYLSMKSIAVIIRTALLLRAGCSKEETPESTEPVKLRSMVMTRVPFIEEGYVCTEMSKLNAQSFISVLSLLIRNATATAVREIVQDKKSVEEVLTSMQKGLQERD